MIKAHIVDRSQLAVPIRATFVESEPDTLAAEHFKTLDDWDAQMSRHEEVEQLENEKLKNN